MKLRNSHAYFLSLIDILEDTNQTLFNLAQTQYFFAYIGIASALVFANLGASYGTAKAAVGISSLAVIDKSKIF